LTATLEATEIRPLQATGIIKQSHALSVRNSPGEKFSFRLTRAAILFIIGLPLTNRRRRVFLDARLKQQLDL
jgi:hypothetical protein